MPIESKMPRPAMVPPPLDAAHGRPFGRRRLPVVPPPGGPLPRRSRWPALAAIVILIAIAVGGWYLWSRSQGADRILEELQGEGEQKIASGAYQAVFLDNGQVYFGKLETRISKLEEDAFVRLTDVFYLEVPGQPAASPNSGVSLVKLGSEMHGPQDFMDINVEHILFVEDLKGDSKVAQAIADYVSKKE